MSRIQSNIGLITGIPIQDTVDQLIAISAQPRDLLVARTNDLQSQQLAVSTLSTRLLAVQFELGQLGQASVFNSRTASSSDPTLLSATIAEGATPAPANYQFTPIRTASSQQFVSQRFESADSTLSAGEFSLRRGGFVDTPIPVDQLNGEQGIDRGEIRITDKSGASSVVDLRFAVTTADVLTAINADSTINVTAETVGDAIRLTDNSGGSGTLTVQEVSGGTTAADLGLDGISAAGTTTVATGTEVFSLASGTRLSQLNDATGVQIRSELADLDITLRDGTNLQVNLDGAATLGDVIDAINAVEPAKFSAAIAADGDRLELTDLTSGATTFAAANASGGTAADDLGLTTTASGGTITGTRLLGGLGTTLVSGLNGGQGLGTLGSVNITDRSGASATVDLSTAETLDDILELINQSGLGIAATVNANRSGILITDTTGSTASNLNVASADANNSAEALGVVVNAAVDSVDSGALNRHTVGLATTLTSLNGGEGIDLKDIRITDSAGAIGAIDLNETDNVAVTLGDVVDRINNSSANVLAQINDTGDGIVVIDQANGSGTLSIEEVGNGTAAADLGILGEATSISVGGSTVSGIDGSGRTTVSIEEGDTLAELVDAINALDAGVTASTINDGLGTRLSLVVDGSGSANALLLELENSEFVLDEISAASDAVLQFGDAQTSLGGLLVTSSTNNFDGVIDGVNLRIEGASNTAVDVVVASTDTSVIDSVEQFADAYNALRDELAELTAFDETSLTTGLLFGTNEALRVDADLSRILTDRYFGLGDLESLEQVGLSVDDEGKLEVDAERLAAAFASDPAALEEFFTNEDVGVVAKIDAVIEQLAGDEGLLSNRTDALQDTIDSNNDRIESHNARLEREQQRLLLQFFQLETLIAGLQENLAALSVLQPVPPISTSAA